MVVLKRQFLLAMLGPSGRRAQAGRPLRPCHGHSDGPQSLVQAATVKLRGMAEGLSDKIISVLETFQNREFIGMHSRVGLRINAVAGGGNQLKGFSNMFCADGAGAGLSCLQPGGASQKVQLPWNSIAGAGQ